LENPALATVAESEISYSNHNESRSCIQNNTIHTFLQRILLHQQRDHLLMKQDLIIRRSPVCRLVSARLTSSIFAFSISMRWERQHWSISWQMSPKKTAKKNMLRGSSGEWRRVRQRSGGRNKDTHETI
jgi:hypothetical protein